MSSAWAPQTNSTYASSVNTWKEFINMRGLGDDFWMVSQTPTTKLNLWILFLDHIATTKKSVTAIDMATSAIRQFFLSNFQEVRFLESDSIKILKKALKNTITSNHPPSDNSKVPLTAESIMELWSLHEAGGYGKMSEKQHFMAVLACSVQFNFALRVSNVVRTTEKVHHHYTVDDVTIEFPISLFVNAINYKEQSSNLPETDIVSIHLVEHSSKTSKSARILSLPTTNPDNMFLINKLLHWMIIANHQLPTDDFFSYSHLGGTTGFTRYTRNANRSDIAYVIKQLVSHNGLDPNMFSCHSLRGGAITTLNLRGENPSDVQRLSNHKSIACFQSYDRSAITMSALFDSNSTKTFTARDQSLILLSRTKGGMNG